MSRRWCSATWARTPAPASPSRAIRRPATNEFYGEFLVNAQGEDVVAGIRTPQKIAELGARWPEHRAAARGRPRAARAALPRHAGHRVHHRARQALRAADAAPGSAPASPRCASRSTWRTSGSSRRSEALLRVEPEALNHLLRPIFDADSEGGRGEGGEAPREGAPGRAGRGERAARVLRARTPRRGARAARRSSSRATRPRPRTSAAWPRRRASSPRSAA